MAIYHTKSKWNSQKIQKQFKNKHRNDFCDWSTNSNHSTSFSIFCNEYHKNIYTNYNNEDELFIDEYDEYTATYWRCNNCAYDNIERDLYCSICKSQFKSTNTTKYASDFITFGDHLPPILDNIVNFEDDIDESIQIAIISSYDDIIKPFPKTELYAKSHKKNKNNTKPKQKTKEEIEGDRRKKEEQKRRQKEERRRREEQRKKKEEEEKQRKYIAKCTEECPKLSAMIGTNIIEFIRTNIEKQYSGNKQFKIKLILNYDVLLKFVSSRSYDNGDDWKWVYHGTDCKNDEGIIKKGLIVGGTKGVGIRNGSCYGRGIYCSPRTSTASGYERGSMFICIVRYKKANRNGTIWVIPNETDILPLYLVSFPTFQTQQEQQIKSKPKFPYFPIPAALQSIIAPNINTISTEINDDGLSQQILKFIPSFTALNNRNSLNRKIKRKWSAYYKINEYQ